MSNRNNIDTCGNILKHPPKFSCYKPHYNKNNSIIACFCYFIIFFIHLSSIFVTTKVIIHRYQQDSNSWLLASPLNICFPHQIQWPTCTLSFHFRAQRRVKKNIPLQQHCKQMPLLVFMWTSDLTLGKIIIKVKVTFNTVSKNELNIPSDSNVTANIKLLACRERWWYQHMIHIDICLFLLKIPNLRTISLSYIQSFPLVPIMVRQCVPLRVFSSFLWRFFKLFFS